MGNDIQMLAKVQIYDVNLLSIVDGLSRVSIELAKRSEMLIVSQIIIIPNNKKNCALLSSMC